MAASTFTVTDPKAPYAAADPFVQGVANEVALEAASNTPVRTGALASSWHVEKRRNSSYLVSSDVPYAHFVEYGSKHNPVPAAPLGRATAAARARYGR